MERRADRQPLRTGLARRSEEKEPLHGRRMARDDDLSAAVQIGGAEDVAVCRLGTERRDRLGIESADRCHRPQAGRDRLLHQPAALADAGDGGVEGERTSRDQRRPLPEAVPGDGERRRADGLLEHAVRRDAGRENRRLRVFGQHEPLLGPLEAQARERHPEPLVRLRERPPRHREGLRQVAAHSHPLRSLAREETDHPSLAHRRLPRAPSRFGRELSLPRSRRPFGRGRSRSVGTPGGAVSPRHTADRR